MILKKCHLLYLQKQFHVIRLNVIHEIKCSEKKRLHHSPYAFENLNNTIVAELLQLSDSNILMHLEMAIYRDNLSAIVIGDKLLPIIVIAENKFDLSITDIAFVFIIMG